MSAIAVGQAITIDKEGPARSKENPSPDTTEKAEPSPEIKSCNPTHEEFQHGVQAAEAVTQLWGKKQLITAYLLIWLIHLLQSFSNNILKFLTPFMTSTFQLHSLTAMTTVISSLISGLFMLPFSKMIDVWGRAQGFVFMLISFVIGVVMMATCKNVETYCAAQVFYQVAYIGLELLVIIFIADTSSMRNRGLMIAFSASSNMGIVWAYGPVANKFILNNNIKWGIGMWAVIMPVVYTPLIALLWYYQVQAEKQGLVTKTKSGRTPFQSTIHYCREVDLIGILLLSAGMSLFLLGLSLYSYQAEQWRAPMIISFLVVGPLLVIAFVLYEIYIAPVRFLDWKSISDPSIFFAFVTYASVFSATFVLISYYVSAYLVLWSLSVPTAMNIGNIQLVGATFSSLIAGLLLRYWGRFKWIAVCIGMPLLYLAVGLMMHFRHSDTTVGYLAMCQLFFSFGLGIMGLCQQMSIMASSNQQQVASLFATAQMIGSTGVSVGTAISGAIWTATFPNKLIHYLPDDGKYLAPKIYGNILVQMTYPNGQPIKNAINQAYSDSLRIMMITAFCLYLVSYIAAMCWRDVNVKKIIINRGQVI